MDVFAQCLPKISAVDQQALTQSFLEEHEAMTKWLEESGSVAQAEAQAYLDTVRKEEEEKNPNTGQKQVKEETCNDPRQRKGEQGKGVKRSITEAGAIT